MHCIGFIVWCGKILFVTKITYSYYTICVFRKIFSFLTVVFAIIGFVFVGVYFAVKFGFTNTTGIIDQQRDQFIQDGLKELPKIVSVQSPTTPLATNTTSEPTPQEQPTYKHWQHTYEWEIIQSALSKDIAVVQRASVDSGVPARLIVAQLVVEQFRLFFSEREAFKKWFEPLKILGSQTQFSWGVMGMKEETAIQVEQHLKDPSSPYYLGTTFEHLLDFQTNDIESERFTRMTDQHDHYYSYLYAGLFLKQIISQWERAGYDVSNSPDILSTIYNLGFSKSIPNPDPKSGGAQITLDGVSYSFGSLGAEFYYSDAMLTEFPRYVLQ